MPIKKNSKKNYRIFEKKSGRLLGGCQLNKYPFILTIEK